LKSKKSLSGAEGETTAARYLEKKGYKILEYNYRIAGSEVDLIALKDNTLFFIEVKTRGSDNYGMPEEFVNERKRRKIIQAAKFFTACKKYEDHYVQFDIIAVLPLQELDSVYHIEHAFEE